MTKGAIPYSDAVRNTRSRTALLCASAFLLVVTLSGCMSSGTSSFGGTTYGKSFSRMNSMREVPLAIAPTNESKPAVPASSASLPIDLPSAPMAASADLNEPSRAVTDQTGSVPAFTANDANLALTSPDLQSLAPETEQLRKRTERELASTGWGGLGLASYPSFGDSYMGMVDSVEAAAQQRSEMLYAAIDHGSCKSGWGPKPKVVNATRMTPGHPYYMEMRLRHTPLLPVGHVYIAYGRLSPEGQILDEKLIMLAPIGGYMGAGIAGAMPMPGVLKPLADDCWVRPEAAYRISLSAQKFEKLLLAIKRAKEEKPNYHLFAFNCNHFMSSVAKSVGVLPPENIYTPSLVYFYEMMDRNEGHKVPRNAAQLKYAQNQSRSLSPVSY